MITIFSGSTGFVGTEILTKLLKDSQEEDRFILILNRNKFIEKNEKIIIRYGDSSKENIWDDLLTEFAVDRIVISSNIRHTKPLLNVIKSKSSCIRPRIIVVGTTGVHSKFKEYSSIYKSLENSISNYDGKFLVLRPTMIYGGYKDKNFHKVIKFIKKYKLFFIFGSGNNLFRPIYYQDLAKAVSKACQDQKIKGFIDLAGETTISYKGLLKLIFFELNIKPRFLTLPSKPIIKFLKIFELFSINLPITSEMINRLQEDKTFEIEKAKIYLNFKPITLSKGIKMQIKSMKRDKYLI